MTEPNSPEYVVKVFTTRGALVFQGTVSQQGDFVHLQKSMYGNCATLRVHDMTPTLQQPAKLDLPVEHGAHRLIRTDIA